MIYPEAFAQAKAYGGHTPRTSPQELRPGDAPLGLSDGVSLSDGAPPAFNMAKTGWEGDASNAQSPARDTTLVADAASAGVGADSVQTAGSLKMPLVKG